MKIPKPNWKGIGNLINAIIGGLNLPDFPDWNDVSDALSGAADWVADKIGDAWDAVFGKRDLAGIDGVVLGLDGPEVEDDDDAFETTVDGDDDDDDDERGEDDDDDDGDEIELDNMNGLGIHSEDAASPSKTIEARADPKNKGGKHRKTKNQSRKTKRNLLVKAKGNIGSRRVGNIENPSPIRRAPNPIAKAKGNMRSQSHISRICIRRGFT